MEHLLQATPQQSETIPTSGDSPSDKHSYQTVTTSMEGRDILRIIRNRSTLGLCMLRDQHLLDYLAHKDTLKKLMQLIFNRITPQNRRIEKHDLGIKSTLAPQLTSSTHVLSDEEFSDPVGEGLSTSQRCVTSDDIGKAIEILRAVECAPTILANIISDPSILRIPFQAIAAVYSFFNNNAQLNSITINPINDTEAKNGCKPAITEAFALLLDICTLSVDNLPILIDTLEHPLFEDAEPSNEGSSSARLIDVWLQLLLENRTGYLFARILANPKDKPAPLLNCISNFLSKQKVFARLINHLFYSAHCNCDAITNILIQSLNTQAPWRNTVTLEFSRVFGLFLLLTGNDLSILLPPHILSNLSILLTTNLPSLSLAFSISDILIHMLQIIMFDAISLSLDIADDPKVQEASSISLYLLEEKGYIHANSWILFIEYLLPALCSATITKLSQCIDASGSKVVSIETLLMLKTLIRFIELTENISNHIDSILVSKSYNCSNDKIFSILSSSTVENNACGILPFSARSLGWDVEPQDLFAKIYYGKASLPCEVSIQKIIDVIIQSGLYNILCKLMHTVPTVTIVLFLCSRLFIIAGFYLAGQDSTLVKETLEKSGIFEEIAAITAKSHPESISPDPVITAKDDAAHVSMPSKFLPYKFRTPISVYFLGILRAFIRLAANVTKTEYELELLRYLSLRESPNKLPTHAMTYSQLQNMSTDINPLGRLLFAHSEVSFTSSEFLWLDNFGGNCYYNEHALFSRCILRLGTSSYVGVSLERLKEYSEKEPTFATPQDWNVNSNLSLKQNIVLGTLRRMLGLKRSTQVELETIDFPNVCTEANAPFSNKEENMADNDSPIDKSEKVDDNIDLDSYLVENVDTGLEGSSEEDPGLENRSEHADNDIIAFAEYMPEELEPPIELANSVSIKGAVEPDSSIEQHDKYIPLEEISNNNVIKPREEKNLPCVEGLGPSICTAAEELTRALNNAPSGPNTRTPLRPALSDSYTTTSSCSIQDNMSPTQPFSGPFERQINIIPLSGEDNMLRSYSPPPIPKSSSPPTVIHNRRSRGFQSPTKPLTTATNISIECAEISSVPKGVILTEKSPRSRPAMRPIPERRHSPFTGIRASNEYCNVPAEGGRFMTYEEASAMFEKQRNNVYQRGRINSADESKEFKPIPRKMLADSSGGSGRFRRSCGRT